MWFWELNASRRTGISGIERLSYSDFVNWLVCTGHVVNRAEIKALGEIDAIWCKGVADEIDAVAQRDATAG